MKRSLLVIALGLACLLPATKTASAADLRLLCSNALQSVMVELGPQFEKATGHKLLITYGSTGPLQADIEKGAAFDVTILGPAAIEALIKQGKIAAGSRVDLARSGMGVAIRKGAPKPDLSSTDAFKRALLNAKSIAYSEAGLTGIYLKGLFQRLGLADELSGKIKFGRGAEMVGKGEAEIGLTQISEILPVAGAELAGPLPPEVQSYTVFPAGIAASAAQPAAAKALLTFLTTPEAARVIAAHGLEPRG
jgi:molybdate transport system substrate-binding protein